MASQSFSITTETMVRAVLVILVCYLIYLVRDVLLLLFISFILATVLHPLVRWAHRHYIPRPLTVLTAYILGAAALFGVAWLMVPLFVSEVMSIVQNFVPLWDKAIILLPPDKSVMIRDAIQQNISEIASTAKNGLFITLSGVLATAQGFAILVGAVILVLVLAFYFVIDDMKLKKLLSWCLPARHAPVTAKFLQNAETRLGGWARGQFILSTIIGVLVYLTLTVIGVPYALALAGLAFFVEFIPYIGPVISGVFGVFFALTVSPTTALITGIAYYVIQQLENNLIVPKVMQKSAGIDPVLSMLSILVCLELFGPIGILLGVPIASLIVATVETFMSQKQLSTLEK